VDEMEGKLIDYTYVSPLAGYMADFICLKRSLGYKYNDEAYFLSQFDRYWAGSGDGSILLTYENVAPYLEQRDTETRRSHSHRIAVLKQFTKYMNQIGFPCFIPDKVIRYPKAITHILSDAEVSSLFAEIDTYLPKNRDCQNIRLGNGYKVLFRLIYCLGLRLSETCSIRISDIDFEKGTIILKEGTKKDKERVVYLPEGLLELVMKTIQDNKNHLKFESYWLFPGYDPTKHVSIHTIDKRFNSSWIKTPFAATCEKKPTVHSLRHTFVVKRMNLWMEQGLDLNVMLPYLSRFLGHKTFHETYYYYHAVLEAYRIIRTKDTVADDIIPEVKCR